MRSITSILAAVVVVSICALAVAQPADDVKAQRDALETKLKELQKKLNEAKIAVSKQDDLVKLSKEADAARKACDAKAAGDAKVVEAKKTANAALANVDTVTKSELMASPEGAAAMKEMATLEDAGEEAQSQQRIVQFILGEVKRKVMKDAQIKDLSAAALAAAAKAKANPQDADPKKALEAADKALDDAVKAKVAANEEGAGQLKKLDDIKAKLLANADAARAANKKLADVRKDVAGKSAKVAEAKKAADTALEAYRAAAAEASKPEKEALDKAVKAYNEALDAKIAADPAVIQIHKDMDDVSAKMKDLKKAPATKGATTRGATREK